jgi:hypothetical protein
MRSARVFRLIWNLPTRVLPQMAEQSLCRHAPEVGAVCGKAARTVLCGGRAMKRASLPLDVTTSAHGTKRTWCDVRLESAMRPEADIVPGHHPAKVTAMMNVQLGAVDRRWMKAEYFCEGGLDSPDQIESFQQIKSYAHAISKFQGASEAPVVQIIRLICPTGAVTRQINSQAYPLRNASRSSLMVAASVVGMPCGKPL